MERSSCPFDMLARKFKATVRALQSWSQRTVGHISSQLELAREVLHQLEIAEDTRGLSGQEQWLRNKLKPQSLALASLQRTNARSRSRISWLSDGDANTALFHLHARHRKRKNFISKLTIEEGMVITDHEQKEKIIFDFCSNLLGISLDREFTVNLEELATSRLNLEDLDASFTEEEVWKTINSMPSDKAPGPDGLQANSIKCAGK